MLALADSGHGILWGVPEYNPELVGSDKAKAGVVSGGGLYLLAATIRSVGFCYGNYIGNGVVWVCYW